MVFNWIKKHTSQDSIVFLQETHSDESFESIWKSQWHGEIEFSHGVNDARGTLICFREGLEYKILNKYNDTDGRFVIIRCMIQDRLFLLANLYNPNKEPQQIEVMDNFISIIKSIDKDHECEIVLGGDFNFIFNTELESDGGNPKLKLSSIATFNSLSNEFSLVDIWRVRNPDKKRYTFRQPTPLIQRRLDFFFISNSLQENVEKVDIILAVRTDHSALLMKINTIQSFQRGRGYWKFNNSLLSNSSFVELMQKEIKSKTDGLDEVSSDPRVRWEYMKYVMRDLSRKFSIEYSRKVGKNRLELENKVKDLSSKLTTSSTESEAKEYEECKAKLEKMYDHITQGIILQSKVAWYEKGEKSNKYFLNLEKRNKAKTHIRKLIDDSKEISDADNILKIVKSYFGNLYSSRSLKTEHECLEYLKGIKAHVLTTDQCKSCEGKLSLNEIYQALVNMPPNKSPGNDGLSKEFYLCFFDMLGSTLMESLNYAFEKGELSSSQRQAVITLIEKKGKDKRYLKNWRPISLLNVDTKILSKALSTHIKKVIGSVIESDQTAYVPGRYIGESVRLTSDILEFTEIHKISGYMITADIEKVFDSIEHNFITATLIKLGFGPNFVLWVKTLLYKQESCVMNNGHSTGFLAALVALVRVIHCLPFYLFCL